MKPPTQAFVQALFLLLVVGPIAEEVIAYHEGYKSHHHEIHHPGHHEGHHHSSSHHGHHGPRAARTRREKATGDTGINSIPCTVEGECSVVSRSKCNTVKGYCTCPVEFPIFDVEHDVCVTEAKLTETCEYDIECETSDEYSLCGPDSNCVCRDGYNMEDLPDVGNNCVRRSSNSGPGNVDAAMIGLFRHRLLVWNPNSGPGAVDPAMIGVLVGLALMFVIICVVLRLFSKARFRENRSIFNTPNPRLMNASLFKDSGVAGRRGSAMSAVSATGSVAHSGGAAPKTPSPAKEGRKKSETTVAIENVD